MKYILSVIVFILICFNLEAQDKKEYRLVSKHTNSDLRYTVFKKYEDFTTWGDKIKESFTPKRGKYDVYIFIGEFTGESFKGTEEVFHDYLIFKTEPRTTKILDGFHYTMEWADPPAALDLYRVTVKNIKLEDKLNLDELKMELVGDYSHIRPQYLSDHGVLVLE